MEKYKGKKLLLLGKTRAFLFDELVYLADIFGVTVKKEFDDTIDTVIEGGVISPPEQDLADELYKKGGYSFVSIDSIEKDLAKSLDIDTLLMSFKLSKDSDRLKDFLTNEYIDDKLFFELLLMYDWGGEDFYENDDNRDVTATIIRRYYKDIHKNHNVEFATTGLLHLVSQTDNQRLLEVLYKLEPVKYHTDLKVAISINPHTPTKVLKDLIDENIIEIKDAVSHNPNLQKEMAFQLVGEEEFAKKIAKNIYLDEELFKALKDYKHELAGNTSLSASMQKELFETNDKETLISLALNENLIEDLAYKLLEENELKSLIYQNSRFGEIHQKGFEEKRFLELSKNRFVASDILEQIYYKDNSFDIQKNLAQNPNTPVDILYQMQLDSRLARYVRENEAFGKHIQTNNIGWL